MFKFIPETHGAHVHVRVFVGDHIDRLALSGTLVMDAVQAHALSAALLGTNEGADEEDMVDYMVHWKTQP